MTFNKWGYEFDGCYNDPSCLQKEQGVYVVWCRRGLIWAVLALGESDNVLDAVVNHERAEEWTASCAGAIYYSAIYTPGQIPEERRETVRSIGEATHSILMA